MHLMMTNGSIRELPQAESAEVEGDFLVLRDAAGAVIESIGRMTVTAFGNFADTLLALLEEPPNAD